jgi:hypothetical protein
MFACLVRAFADHFTVVWQFEFGVGATLDLSLRMENTESMQRANNSIQFMFCNDDDIEVLKDCALNGQSHVVHQPLKNARLIDVCESTTFNFVTTCKSVTLVLAGKEEPRCVNM